MRRPAAKRAAVVVLALAVLAAAVPPFINVSRYKGRITGTIGQALGSPVTAGHIRLRILPQPGFDMTGVEIGDDPSFSPGPILRADEVTAYLRLSSLWRGRLEVARLTLKYPSLNLARRADGHWNIESLLWKLSQTPVAPTSSRRPEARLRFPYIAAENGRINFQRGLERSVFSFTDADFSLWSPAENEWRMRLEARPVRTDVPISDTGTFRAEATFHRAAALRDVPLQVTAVWERAQLGQLTRLVSGSDFGWRGGVNLSAQLSGTPGDLHFDTVATIDDLRRYDVFAGAPLVLSTQCSGTFASSDDSVRKVYCRLPVGDGQIVLDGSLAGPDVSRYDISLYAANLPAAEIVNIARHVRHELAPDLTASGTLTAAFKVRRLPGEPEQVFIGNGMLNALSLRSSVLEKDLALGNLNFSINTSPRITGSRSGRKPTRAPRQTVLRLTGLGLALGGKEPAHLAGDLSANGFDLHITGDSSLQRLLQASRAFGVAAPRISMLGEASVELELRGGWLNDETRLTGGAHLRNALAEIPGLASPLELTDAQLAFTGDRLIFHILSGANGKTKFTGTADVPRSCAENGACSSTFDLQFDEVDVSQWNAELNPRLKKGPWYRLFGSSEERSVMATLNASGAVRAHRVHVGSAIATNLEGRLEMHDSRATLKGLRAELMGGTLSGEWTLLHSGDAPEYDGRGEFSRINLAQLSAATDTNVGTGTLNGHYELKMSGWEQKELAASAAGSSRVNWSNGVVRCFVLDPRRPLNVRSYSTSVTLADRKLTIESATMQTATGAYTVSGSATLERELDLNFAAQDSVWHVTGTLQKPQVSEAPAAPGAPAAAR